MPCSPQFKTERSDIFGKGLVDEMIVDNIFHGAMVVMGVAISAYRQMALRAVGISHNVGVGLPLQ